MAGIVWLVALTALVYVRSEPTPEQQCATPTITTIKFSFESRRNRTGYWMSQFDFDNEGGNKSPSDGVDTPTSSVGVEQNAVACGDGKSTLHSKIIVAVPGVDAKVNPVPAGYELFPGAGYYKFHPDAANWARARQVCAEEGAQLIVINSEHEANVLKQLFTRFPKEKITNYDSTLYEWSWVGVYEQGANGQYFTIQGQTLNQTGFSRWHPGQPDGGGSDDCILAYALGAGYNDVGCFYRSAYICEY